MKVKIIVDYHENLEEQINEFLKENNNNIEVIDIKWKVHGLTHWAMIIYKYK